MSQTNGRSPGRVRITAAPLNLHKAAVQVRIPADVLVTYSASYVNQAAPDTAESAKFDLIDLTLPSDQQVNWLRVENGSAKAFEYINLQWVTFRTRLLMNKASCVAPAR